MALNVLIPKISTSGEFVQLKALPSERGRWLRVGVQRDLSVSFLEVDFREIFGVCDFVEDI